MSEAWLDFERCVYNLDATDSLSELFLKYDTDCLQILNGDFAYVMYDNVQKHLFGVVIRLGTKTLYYHVDNECPECSTMFLHSCKGKNYTIDPYACRCYSTMQYILSPHTIINEVKS